MDRVRLTIRRALLWIALGLLGAILFGPVGELFIEWGRELGWYDHPSQTVEIAISATANLFGHPIMQWAIAATFGLATGVWLDWLSRKAVQRSQPSNGSDPELLRLRNQVEQLEQERKTTLFQLKSLYSLFYLWLDDFRDYHRVSGHLAMQSTKFKPFQIEISVCHDTAAGGMFAAVYVPMCERPVDAASSIARSIRNKVEQMMQGLEIVWEDHGSTDIGSTKNVIFTNTVYLYMEGLLTLEQMADIKKEFSHNALTVRLRGRSYLQARKKDEKVADE